uniref:Protein LAP2-like n=1 Tax=Saccoglossus kowalevskii TaxID=10224 RepID=A0ABM0MI97_SACKO|nr:PREDICTED: protein LAP2-like [Saccoglossus kowalevskii]
MPLPDGFTQLLNLTHLYLNDTFLDYLPANFGRLVKLKILEIRENHLKSLPKYPEVVGTLVNLTELWVDSNTLSKIPSFIGNLKRLQYFDGSKNKIESLPPEVDGLESLTDMHLSTNCLKLLPESIGKLSKLSTLKVDDNQLSMLPYSIGGMISMEELILNMNDLQELPPSIGLLRNIRHLNVDDNLLFDLPSELGSCSHIRLLSLRGNKLEVLPDELGRISRLTVVNLSNNRLKYLPFNFCKLKNLQALWLSDNQSKPLIPLQTDWDEYYQNRILTCFMFPQQPRLPDDEIYFSDGESFHPSLWEEERRAKKQIMFDVNDSESERSYKRSPTPFPKEPYKPRRLVLTQPNGDIPDGRRGHNKTPGYSAVETNRLGLGPDIRIGEAKVTKPSKPSSPLHDRHHLYNADKKKSAKDKARIRRGSRDSTGTESDTSPTRSLLSSSNSSPSRKPEMMIHSTSGRSINDDDSEDIMVAAKQPIVTAPPHRDSPSPDSGKGSPGERSPLTSTSPMDNSPIRTLPDGSPVRSLPDGSSTKSPTSPTTVLPAPSGSSDKITLPHESPKKIVSGIQSPVKQSSGNCSPARRIPPNGSVSSSPVKRATKTGSPVKVVHSQVHNKTNTLPSSMGSPTKTKWRSAVARATTNAGYCE